MKYISQLTENLDLLLFVWQFMWVLFLLPFFAHFQISKDYFLNSEMYFIT